MSLAFRTAALERGLLTLARIEFGDVEGHPFHGNQWTSGSGVEADIIEHVKAEGGITIDAVTGTEPTTGFIVATAEDSKTLDDHDFFDDREAGIAAIDAYLGEHADALSGDRMFGVWHDVEHGEVVFDVVEHIEDRAQAVKLGGERDQQAVWDVEHGAEISTGGTGGR